MDAKDFATYAGPVISVVSLGFTIYFANKARGEKTAAAQEKLLATEERIKTQEAAKAVANATVGQLETMLRTSIQQTSSQVRDLHLRIADIMNGRKLDKLTADERRRVEAYVTAATQAVEENLNAYEDACGKYLDNKIDPVRFKKMYVEEIRNLCRTDDELIAGHLQPESKGDFQAMWKVYREWHMHEK